MHSKCILESVVSSHCVRVCHFFSLFNGIFKNGASYNSWLQLKPVFKLPFLLFYTNIMNICELYEVYK